MGSHWKRIAVPAIGLAAVMAALAIVAGASIVLFPAENHLEGLPPPLADSSEVTQVTASPHGQGGSTGGTAPGDRAGSAPAPDAPFTAAPGSPSGGGGAPTATQPPLVRGPANTEEPSGQEQDGPRDHDPDKAKQKEKHRNGWAKGHEKSHGKGNAKGHDKWHSDREDEAKGHGKSHSGRVAFAPPRGKKHDHVQHSGAGKHADRRDRPHARPRS